MEIFAPQCSIAHNSSTMQHKILRPIPFTLYELIDYFLTCPDGIQWLFGASAFGVFIAVCQAIVFVSWPMCDAYIVQSMHWSTCHNWETLCNATEMEKESPSKEWCVERTCSGGHHQRYVPATRLKPCNGLTLHIKLKPQIMLVHHVKRPKLAAVFPPIQMSVSIATTGD